MRKQKKSVDDSIIKKYIMTEVPVADENDTIKKVLTILEKSNNKYQSVDYIYVTNKKEELVGMFYIEELFNSKKNSIVKSIMQKSFTTINQKTDLEKIAHFSLKHNLKQVPVTDSKKLIGVVPTEKILAVINKSLKNDIFHFAGVHKSHLEFENSLEIPKIKAIKQRLPWLFLGLFGAMFMTMYIRIFEATLAKHIIIASFVPAIVYLSGALGSQTQTIFIRDLAVLGKNINLKKYLLRQVVIGGCVGLIMASIIFLFISLIGAGNTIAFAISLSSLITIFLTGFTSLAIPLLIKRFKFDPALGSGPVATILSDITSVVIYFIIVVLIL